MPHSAVSSTYVELAIGLVLAFFLLSLLVSWLNEAVVRVFSIRGKYLWAYLRDTLDGAEKQVSRLPARIRDVFVKLPFNLIPGGDPRPAYSPTPAPSTMAEEVPPFTRELYERLQEIDRPKWSRSAISQIPPARFAVAILEIVTGRYNSNVDEFVAALEAAKSPLSLPVKSLWATANGDLELLRKGVETWFDTEMQRLTQLYRRHIRLVLTVIATAVVLLFSVDSLEYGKMLLADEAYRTEIVAVANGNPEAMERLQRDCAAAAGAAGSTSTDPYACLTQNLSTPAFIKLFQHAPVRFDLARSGTPTWAWNHTDWRDRLNPAHWLGFALTIVALNFGAPFWWDVLRRITGARRILSPRS